ncbi:hypothetical protein BDF14DRAFT_626868 [Spinellus fusiger]|nr:hypothetical protein BDF14DRAFT_626868 [Spinellus fusiger]
MLVSEGCVCQSTTIAEGERMPILMWAYDLQLSSPLHNRTLHRRDMDSSTTLTAVGIGCVVGVLLLAFAGLLWYRHRQKKKMADEYAQNTRISYALSHAHTHTQPHAPRVHSSTSASAFKDPYLQDNTPKNSPHQVFPPSTPSTPSTPMAAQMPTDTSHPPMTYTGPPIETPCIAVIRAQSLSKSRPANDALRLQAVRYSSFLGEEALSSPRLQLPPSPHSFHETRPSSLSSHKSVNSVQWIGFNESMEYRWQPQLQVANQPTSHSSLNTHSTHSIYSTHSTHNTPSGTPVTSSFAFNVHRA